MREYPLGQSIRLSASFANSSGTATDPTTVTFQTGLRAAAPPPDPTATAKVYGTDVEVVKDSTGRYHYDFTPTASGVYATRVVATGTVAAAAVSLLRVLPSPFA